LGTAKKEKRKSANGPYGEYLIPERKTLGPRPFELSTKAGPARKGETEKEGSNKEQKGGKGKTWGSESRTRRHSPLRAAKKEKEEKGKGQEYLGGTKVRHLRVRRRKKRGPADILPQEEKKKKETTLPAKGMVRPLA